jgi:hypothetical protein
VGKFGAVLADAGVEAVAESGEDGGTERLISLPPFADALASFEVIIDGRFSANY